MRGSFSRAMVKKYRIACATISLSRVAATYRVARRAWSRLPRAITRHLCASNPLEWQHVEEGRHNGDRTVIQSGGISDQCSCMTEVNCSGKFVVSSTWLLLPNGEPPRNTSCCTDAVTSIPQKKVSICYGAVISCIDS